jgi:general secretion pathway protein L
MKMFDAIRHGFWHWLDGVAGTVVALLSRFVTPRTLTLTEHGPGRFSVVASDKKDAATLRAVELRVEDGALIAPTPQVEAALRGSRVELTLRPDRFVFKPLDLPARAEEFLDGVVRAQIDRLTPWSAELAAFGFSAPVEAGPGRLTVTIAATAKAMLSPFVQAFAAKGAHAVTLATLPPDQPLAPPIAIMDESLTGLLGLRTARRILLIVLASCGVAAAAAIIAATIVGGNLQSRQDDLARRITERRVAAMAARGASGDATTGAELALAKRKNETPSAVIAIEALSRVLPDRTYVSELRIEADKLRLSGVTDDAPGIIRLLEQTPQFTQATFFAPITRSPSDPGDRFNIEARIEPVFAIKP